MKKYLLLLMAIMLATVARAADGDTFEYNGLNYTILSETDHTVEVYYGQFGYWSGYIPSFVTLNGSRYVVIGIAQGAFIDCSSLTSVTIPNSVTSIGEYAFSRCSRLTSVTIPNSVTSIGSGPFEACINLNEIRVEAGNEYYCADNGALYNYNKTCLIQCPGAKTEFEIPTSVTEIEDFAFSGCSPLTSVTISNSVTSIGRYAFDGCSSLTSVTIPNSVTSLGGFAFSDCSGLTSVIISNSVTSIGRDTFDGCSSLTSVTIPNSVTSIGLSAFRGCSSLTSVTIPDSVTEIGSSAFENCSGLTSVTIPNSVTKIMNETFNRCSSLTSVTIPNSVTSIGQYAFSGCSSLTSVTIPNSVTSIGRCAFSWCSELTSVTIPNSVKEIFDGTFEDCQNLRTIIDLNPSPQLVDDGSFEGVPSGAVVYIPKGCYMTYMLADGWTKFSDFREMGAFDITISDSTLELTPGETSELTVTVVKDDDVTVGDHEWVSFNPEVATVENGKVTAVSPGTTTINYTEYTIIAGIAVPHTVACEVTVTETTGIRDIVEEDDAAAPADVFNLHGVQVLRNATEAEINALPTGIYIVRKGRTAKKIVVK